MLQFSAFLTEASKAVGIQHLEHPSDRTFDGSKPASQALTALRGVALGRSPITRKIDDKMSFQIVREKDGRVGVKYKGPGAKYNYTASDVDTQHGKKPYLAEPLKAILAHGYKVLPKRAGEWQGGFMSTPETREETDGKISHTPNTIKYAVDKNSPEGKKLAKSKLSITVHTELKGRNKKATPITDQSEFGEHPDVHLVRHAIGKEEQRLSPKDRKAVVEKLAAAQKLMKGHSYEHLAGHEATLRTYVNSTVDSGEKPNVQGYTRHLANRWAKEIDKVKTEKAKNTKAAARDSALEHVKNNSAAFKNTFDIHHNTQKATNLLARGLNKTASGEYSHSIGGKESGPEGYFAKGLKVVDREEFSKLNRARSAVLRGQKSII